MDKYNVTLDPSVNQWLAISERASRTKQTDPVIARLDRFFCEANMRMVVNSILRSESEQLGLIMQFAYRKGLKPTFCVDDVYRLTPDKTKYVWQMLWSQLLSLGVIINPPIAAICLLDSYRKNGSDRLAQLISASPHIKGTAFDLGISALPIIELAMKSDIGITTITVERDKDQQCVHVNVLG